AAREPCVAARLPFTWCDPPAALEVAVIAAGLQAVSRETAMAADLTRFAEHAAAPAELVIERVADVQGALRWRETFRVAHGAPTSPNTARPRTFAPASYDEGEPLRLYSAHLRGMPVATAQLFMGAGVAGVYCVATVPHARRQGAGAAVTAAALRDARALGYYAGVLGATEMGASVYRGLGFAPCGELSEFVWEPQ
ncbi:MAG: GNAT family N-acetyltransferase, partial [Ktedonobacterales bacterium]